MYPIFEKLSRQLTFMLSTALARQSFNIFKTLYFNRLSNDKHLKSLSVEDMFSRGYREMMVGNVVFVHGAAISLVTDFDSPAILLNDTLYLK